MLNMTLAALAGAVATLLIWSVARAGLDAKYNAVAVSVIIVMLGALSWNFFKEAQNILLCACLALGVATFVGGWVSLVKHSPSIMHRLE